MTKEEANAIAREKLMSGLNLDETTTEKSQASENANTEHKVLRPCPFCGGQAKLLSLELGYDGGKVYGVFCQDDLKQEFQHGHFVDNHSSPQEAIDDWNGRVYP